MVEVAKIALEFIVVFLMVYFGYYLFSYKKIKKFNRNKMPANIKYLVFKYKPHVHSLWSLKFEQGQCKSSLVLPEQGQLPLFLSIILVKELTILSLGFKVNPSLINISIVKLLGFEPK